MHHKQEFGKVFVNCLLLCYGQQAPVVQKLDSAIHRINLYPLAIDSIIGFPNTYPLDSDLSG